jgi:hypothetical protein
MHLLDRTSFRLLGTIDWETVSYLQPTRLVPHSIPIQEPGADACLFECSSNIRRITHRVQLVVYLPLVGSGTTRHMRLTDRIKKAVAAGREVTRGRPSLSG